jgi:hypothetical protein
MSCDDVHVAKVSEITRSNHHFTMWEIAEECNISTGSYNDTVATKLEMHPVRFNLSRDF